MVSKELNSIVINRVIDFLNKYNLADKTILIGFSGGYDSMCLLDIMSKIKEKPEFLKMDIIAVHFNHNWRGQESLKEQEICRIFASSRGFDFYTKTAQGEIKKTENDARIARYDFFEEAIDEFDADALFTAHNLDDNSETILYRIIKGTGIQGLQGIATKRDKYYRPLLSTTRNEILEYCKKNNLTPNNDSSNSNIEYNRNYLRLNIIPSLERINPSVKEALNTLSVITQNDNEIIEEVLASHRDKVFKDETINVSYYKTLSYPIKMRFLHEYVQMIEIDYDYKKICDLYKFIEENSDKRNGSTISLASALWLYTDSKIVETIPRKNKVIVENNEVIINEAGEFEFGDKRFNIQEFVDEEIFIFPPATSTFAYVNLSNIEFPLTLRTRKDGDIINPFGMGGKMKLKKYMNSKAIPRHIRDEIMLLCKDNEVLWAVGLGISNKIAVSEKPTHVIEIITPSPESNLVEIKID